MLLPFFESILNRCWYRPGTAHRILMGPMKGMWFKCSENTGLAALCSNNERDDQRVYASDVK
jgi:hypothetical protein